MNTCRCLNCLGDVRMMQRCSIVRFHNAGYVHNIMLEFLVKLYGETPCMY